MSPSLGILSPGGIVVLEPVSVGLPQRALLVVMVAWWLVLAVNVKRSGMPRPASEQVTHTQRHFRERVGGVAGQWSGWGTATTVRSSIPAKSRGLQVCRGRSLDMAIAAIIAS